MSDVDALQAAYDEAAVAWSDARAEAERIAQTAANTPRHRIAVRKANELAAPAEEAHRALQIAKVGAKQEELLTHAAKQAALEQRKAAYNKVLEEVDVVRKAREVGYPINRTHLEKLQAMIDGGPGEPTDEEIAANLESERDKLLSEAARRHEVRLLQLAGDAKGARTLEARYEAERAEQWKPDPTPRRDPADVKRWVDAALTGEA